MHCTLTPLPSSLFTNSTTKSILVCVCGREALLPATVAAIAVLVCVCAPPSAFCPARFALSSLPSFSSLFSVFAFVHVDVAADGLFPFLTHLAAWGCFLLIVVDCGRLRNGTQPNTLPSSPPSAAPVNLQLLHIHLPFPFVFAQASFAGVFSLFLLFVFCGDADKPSRVVNVQLKKGTAQGAFISNCVN
jgi:hypothetical protein